jgi:hypothetical protein
MSLSSRSSGPEPHRAEAGGRRRFPDDPALDGAATGGTTCGKAIGAVPDLCSVVASGEPARWLWREVVEVFQGGRR